MIRLGGVMLAALAFAVLAATVPMAHAVPEPTGGLHYRESGNPQNTDSTTFDSDGGFRFIIAADARFDAHVWLVFDTEVTVTYQNEHQLTTNASYSNVPFELGCNTHVFVVTEGGGTANYHLLAHVGTEKPPFPCDIPGTLRVSGIEWASGDKSGRLAATGSSSVTDRQVSIGAGSGGTIPVTLTLHFPDRVTGQFAGVSGPSPLTTTVDMTPGCNYIDVTLTSYTTLSETHTLVTHVGDGGTADCGSTSPDGDDDTGTSVSSSKTRSSPAPGGSGGFLAFLVSVPPPPRDTTPPHTVSVERTGEATTNSTALAWDVEFSEPVRIGALSHIDLPGYANATIPDMGTVSDTILVNVAGNVTGGTVSVDLAHTNTGDLLIELVAPDCTRYVVHNQTFAWLYDLRKPHDLGDLAGVGAAGPWTLAVSDMGKWLDGTLNSWNLRLESDGGVEGSGREYTFTQYAGMPGNHTLNLDTYDIRDMAGNPLSDAEPGTNEPYVVERPAAHACR